MYILAIKTVPYGYDPTPPSVIDEDYVFWCAELTECYKKIVEFNTDPKQSHLAFGSYSTHSYLIFETKINGTLEVIFEFFSKDHFDSWMRSRELDIKW